MAVAVEINLRARESTATSASNLIARRDGSGTNGPSSAVHCAVRVLHLAHNYLCEGCPRQCQVNVTPEN